MQWFDPSILIWIGISIILNGFIIYFWHKKFYLNLGLKNYQAIQRIHLNETPRLGGLVLLISLIGYAMHTESFEIISLLKLILVCLIPTLLTGLREDLFHDVKPRIRLLSLFFAAWLFLFKFTGQLPNLAHIVFIKKLLFIQGGVSFFYILSVTAIANGMNLIDGVNGLCGAVALSIFSALLFLSYKTVDITMLSLVFSLILLVISFMLMNYPYGKIFLGDLGAYSLGLIASMITIIFFGRHPEISPWAAVLILIYPTTELTFSILRRSTAGVSIFNPDTEHLHLKLYNFFRLKLKNKKIANALVAPILGGLWLFPLIALMWTYNNIIFIWAGIILFIIFYILIYLTLPSGHTKLIKKK